MKGSSFGMFENPNKNLVQPSLAKPLIQAAFPFGCTGIALEMEGTEMQESGPLTVLKDIFSRC